MNRNPLIRLTTIFGIPALAFALASCGGGGSGSLAGIGGTGITTIGTITGFGSIFVNGVEYDTTNATIMKDGSSTTNDRDLAVGMVVKVKGTLNPDGTSGTATQVIYNDEIQGPVSDTSGLFSLTQGSFGLLNNAVQVNVDANTRWKNVTSKTDLTNAYVEVSGFRNDYVITATYVEKKTSDEEKDKAEIKGTLSSDGLTIRLVFDPNVVLNIDTTTAGCKDPFADLGLKGGSFVELKGTLSGDPIDTLCVLSGEEEDENPLKGVNGEVELEGLIEDPVTPGISFYLLGHPVNYQFATLDLKGNTIAVGLRVEVKGTYSGGTLIADRVEAED